MMHLNHTAPLGKIIIENTFKQSCCIVAFLRDILSKGQKILLSKGSFKKSQATLTCPTQKYILIHTRVHITYPLSKAIYISLQLFSIIDSNTCHQQNNNITTTPSPNSKRRQVNNSLNRGLLSAGKGSKKPHPFTKKLILH